MTTIQFLYSLIGTPLGYILYFIYRFICSNVGLAILIFTFIVKLAMLPLSIKQQKSSAKSAVFQPKVMEIQQKYRNNPQKQQDELMKLQQQGYKPMSGCGTMLLSFLLLFGVIDVVYKPLTHIVHMSKENITEMVEESYNVEVASFFAEELSKSEEELDDAGKERLNNVRKDAQRILDYYNDNCAEDGKTYDISVFRTVSIDGAKIIKGTFSSAVAEAYKADTSDKKKKQKVINDTDLYALTEEERKVYNELTDDAEKAEFTSRNSFSKPLTDMLTTTSTHYGGYVSTSADGAGFTASSGMQRELFALERFGTKVNDVNCSDAYSNSVISSGVKEELTELHNNLNFIGIPLGRVPNMSFPLVLIPIISFIMALLQTFISQRLMTQTNPEAAKSMGPMKVMLFAMPLMSLWIAFSVPAGAGFYWTISYFFGIIQTILLNKLYNPAKLREQVEAELNAKSKAKTVNVDAVKVVNEDGTEETLTQKEINRRKLAAARKADAEKYGEEYNEEDDDD